MRLWHRLAAWCKGGSALLPGRLGAFSLDALKNERLDLENALRRLDRQLQELETQASQLREAYAAYKAEGQAGHQTLVVREYEDVLAQMRAVQVRHAQTQRWARVLATLVRLKEDAGLLERRGRQSVQAMDLQQLTAMVEEALARNDDSANQLTELLHMIDTDQKRIDSLLDAGQLDVRDALDTWAAAREQTENSEITRALAEIEQEMQAARMAPILSQSAVR